MNLDQACTNTIRTLDIWTGDVSLEPLPGGITNHNYIVNDASGSYVARVCVDKSVLGIDRRNEMACQQAAWKLGVAPRVVHHANGVMISDRLHARTLKAEEIREPAFLPRLVAVLKRLHDGWAELSGEMLYFSAFQTVRTYARTAVELGARVPQNLAAMVADAGRLSETIAPFIPVLCHNDLLAANVLSTEDRVWLVDWEYAGIGHPLFDLACLSGNCGFSRDQERSMLEAYRGRIDLVDLRELAVLKAVSLLREALWAMIQTVASDIVFDYHEYAAQNFEAYQKAREEI